MHVPGKDLEVFFLSRFPVPQTVAGTSRVADRPACLEQLATAQNSLQGAAELSKSEDTHKTDRREYRRVSVNEPARVMLMHPTISDLFPARILDVSTGGLKAEVSQLLFAGATLLILREQSVAIGEVRYCIQSGKAFHAGVSIQDVFDKTQFRL